MFRTFKVVGILAIAAATGGCVMQHGPEGVAYSTPSSGGVGMTSGTGGGSLSGTSGPADGGEKEQRGNTPIGMDRDGHGPAAGAIHDPMGVIRQKSQ